MTSTEITTKADDPTLALYFPDAGSAGLDEDDMDGLTPDITRITIPAGGSLSFEVPGENPDRPDSLDAIEAIVVHNHKATVLWLEPMGKRGDEGGRPHAFSDDGVHQVVTEEGEEFLKNNPHLPRPSSLVSDCPYYQWGSATLVDPDANPRGKATKELRRLYLVRAGETVPELLTLAPTSLKPWSNYVVKQAAKHGGPGKVLTRITLERVVKGTIKYSVAKFGVVCPLTPDLVSASEEAKAMVKAQTQRQPAITGDDYTTKPATTEGSTIEDTFPDD